jgi:hypothetical protein
MSCLGLRTQGGLTYGLGLLSTPLKRRRPLSREGPSLPALDSALSRGRYPSSRVLCTFVAASHAGHTGSPSPSTSGGVEVIRMFGHSGISLFSAVTAVVASILVSVFIASGKVGVVGVEEVVNVELRAIDSISTKVVIFLRGFPTSTFLSIFYFAEGILTSFTFQRVNKLCKAATYVVLEQYYRNDIISVVLG